MAEYDGHIRCQHPVPNRSVLEQLSPEELAQAMEQALDDMTEDTYDQAVIDAYLDALDAKTPMPEPPDVEDSYAQFQSMLTGALPPRPKRRGKVLRMTLRVALAAAFLFGCLVAAQAAGVDVFGAVARWTDETFRFEVQQTHTTSDWYVPYEEEFESVGLDAAFMPTWIPEGYTVGEIEIFELPDSTEICIPFYYSDGSTIHCFISSYASLNDMQTFVFEKDNHPVEEYQVNGKTVYLFHNLDAVKAVCQHNNFVYTLTGAVTEDIALNFFASIGLNS